MCALLEVAVTRHAPYSWSGLTMRRVFIVMGVLFTGLIGVALGGLGYLGVMASQSAETN